MGAINLIQRGYSEMYHYISQLFFYGSYVCIVILLTLHYTATIFVCKACNAAH